MRVLEEKRYNPNIMKKAKNNGFINILCLAIGGKDRCLSVWSTARRRALVVLRDLFTHSISDLTWSASGHELMVCSLDGSIAYLCFTKEELGEPLSLEETVQHHRGAYGQSLIDNLLSSSRSLENNFSYAFNQKAGSVVLETPEALALQRQQEELRQRMGNTTSNNSGVKVAEKVQWTSQKESRTKDGRRRITPSFLHTVQRGQRAHVCHAKGHELGPYLCSFIDLDDNSGQRGGSQIASFLSEWLLSAFSLPKLIVVDGVVEAPNSALPPVAEESSKDVSISSPPKTGAISTPVSKSIEQPSVVIVSDKTPTSINAVAIKSPSNAAAASSTTLRKQQQEQVPPPKAKKRVEMTTITGETKTIEKRSNKTPAGVKKRKRIRNLDDDEGEDVPVLTATNTTIQDRHPSAAKAGDRVAEKVGKLIALSIGSGRRDCDTGNTPEDLRSLPSFCERSLKDRGAAQIVTFRAPQLKVADQMDLCGNQAQFVCDHPIDGPIVVKVANAEGGKNAVHKITGSQSTDGNVKTVWTFLSSYRFTSHAHSGKWLAAGDVNSNLRLLWSTGCAICPPLRLDSPAQILAATVLDDSTEKLAVLTVSGCLTIWKLSVKMLSSLGSHLGCSMEKNLPKIVLTTKLDNTRFPAVDLTFSPGEIKHPVVYFKLGSSALFHVERKLWVELFNAGEGGEDSFKRRAAATLYRTCPSGPLSEMQKFGRLNVLVTGDLSANTPSHRRDLQEFYDAQIQVAEMFGSAAEFKFWLSRWFQQLVIESDERRIRQVCLDFIGPVSSALNTSWESTIKGLSKRSLMKQLFPHFAMNLGMQRLYVEMKELFDNTEDSE
ncbi:hypothetical protein ACTXT7_010709 [Hymenolepis weldensis]